MAKAVVNPIRTPDLKVGVSYFFYKMLIFNSNKSNDDIKECFKIVSKYKICIFTETKS